MKSQIYKKLFTLFVIIVSANLFSLNIKNLSDKVTNLPNYGKPHTLQLSGYLSTSNQRVSNGHIYYWLVTAESDSDSAPVILWINGGPGASSLFGFFAENGPYSVNSKLELVDNQYSWHKKFNYLIFDQPTNVGYSYTTDGRVVANEGQSTMEFYQAIASFYKKYPELLTHKLYIAGQSYAGKYIPEVAQYILNQNTKSVNIKIPLSGIIIGNGWVNPLQQQSADADYAYSHGLITLSEKHEADKLFQECARQINLAHPSSKLANKSCAKIGEYIQKKSGIPNMHNIVNLNPNSNFDFIVKYLNLPEVKTSLHVRENQKFAFFNDPVESALQIGEQDPSTGIILELLNKKLNVLIYNGLNDGSDCNFMGLNLSIQLMNWQGFNQVNRRVLINNSKQTIGYMRKYKNLTYINLLNASHSVPIDQPENAQEMIYKWIYDEYK